MPRDPEPQRVWPRWCSCSWKRTLLLRGTCIWCHRLLGQVTSPFSGSGFQPKSSDSLRTRNLCLWTRCLSLGRKHWAQECSTNWFINEVLFGEIGFDSITEIGAPHFGGPQVVESVHSALNTFYNSFFISWKRFDFGKEYCILEGEVLSGLSWIWEGVDMITDIASESKVYKTLLATKISLFLFFSNNLGKRKKLKMINRFKSFITMREFVTHTITVSVAVVFLGSFLLFG